MKNQAAYSQIQAYETSQMEDNQSLPTLEKKDLSSQRLKKVKIVTSATMRLQDKPYPSLIKDICHISFPSLTYLNLRNSEIQNIQAIAFLQCPVLATLQLYGNNITNMNPITNNYEMKKLRTLTFYNNPLKYPWQLQRQNMYNHSEFQFEQSQNANCTIEDLSFLFKTPAKRITKIYIYSNQRIKQQKILTLINQFSYRKQ